MSYSSPMKRHLSEAGQKSTINANTKILKDLLSLHTFCLYGIYIEYIALTKQRVSLSFRKQDKK